MSDVEPKQSVDGHKVTRPRVLAYRGDPVELKNWLMVIRKKQMIYELSEWGDINFGIRCG